MVLSSLECAAGLLTRPNNTTVVRTSKFECKDMGSPLAKFGTSACKIGTGYGPRPVTRTAQSWSMRVFHRCAGNCRLSSESVGRGGQPLPRRAKTADIFRQEDGMYVVIGATGHTGSIVAEKLLAKQERVRAVARDERRLEGLKQQGAEAFVGDVTDASAMARAFSGAEAAYVMIPPNPSSPNVLGSAQLVSESLAAALENNGV